MRRRGSAGEEEEREGAGHTITTLGLSVVMLNNNQTIITLWGAGLRDMNAMICALLS